MRKLLHKSLAAFLCLAPYGLVSGPSPDGQLNRICVPLWVDPQPKCLAPQHMKVTLNGKPAPILQMLDPSSDLVVLLVLDLTGDISLVDAAKQALIGQIDELPPNAWVGLLRAQDGLSVIDDPTPDRKTIDAAIQTLPVTGNAGLLDTVQPVAGLADGILRKSKVRVAVLYITDSDVYNYREDFTNPVINSSDPHDLSRRFPEALIQEKISRLQTQISSYEAPLFIIHLRYRSSRMNQAYQNGLKTLSEFTAGFGLFCRSDAEIPDAIQKVFAYLRSCWFLSLGLPARTPGAVQVRLQLPEDRQSHVAYRARLLLKVK